MYFCSSYYDWLLCHIFEAETKKEFLIFGQMKNVAIPIVDSTFQIVNRTGWCVDVNIDFFLCQHLLVFFSPSVEANWLQKLKINGKNVWLIAGNIGLNRFILHYFLLGTQKGLPQIFWLWFSILFVLFCATTTKKDYEVEKNAVEISVNHV